MSLRKRIERAELSARAGLSRHPDNLRELLAVWRVEGDTESIAWLFPGERIEPDNLDCRIAAEVRAHPSVFWQQMEKAYGAFADDFPARRG